MKTMKKKSKALVTSEMLDAAVETVLTGVDNLVDSLRKDIKRDLKNEIDPIKTDIVFIKRDISDIKADLSDTASRREFNKLKS